jgi:putative DNA-invertase from lambdoid prophage Rac
MATYGYARVSTSQQAREGDSLPAQERMIAGYAQILGTKVDRVFVERGVSGSRPLRERPEGAALLAALQPGDTVITTKLDRMFRSARDALDVLEDLRKRGRVSLHMIDLGGDVCGNGISKLVFTILSAVAEAERDRTRERVLDIIADKRKRGVHVGGQRPTGYCIAEDGTLVPNETEQKAIARMVKLRATGLSFRAVAEKVSAETGVKVSHETCRALVTAATAGKRARPRRKRTDEEGTA